MAKESASSTKKRAQEIVRVLSAEYLNPQTALVYKSPFELLIATILSAQCTDARVNKVTPLLFAQAKTPEAMVTLGVAEVERIIASVNFYRNKAKNIISCSKKLIEEYSSQVPKNIGSLTTLPGVGRKTAQVVLGEVFAVPGVVVDTHVLRLSNRLGLGRSFKPEIVEQSLRKYVDPEHWIKLSHLFILHGRKTCTARKMFCETCIVAKFCPSRGKDANEWKKGKIK